MSSGPEKLGFVIWPLTKFMKFRKWTKISDF